MRAVLAGSGRAFAVVLQDRSGEYLFFTGAVYASLLLLKKRRWIEAAAAFILGIAWLAFHLPVSLYLESLGIDSFAETKNFNLEEARFWIQTLRGTIYPDLSLKKLVAYLAFSLLSFHVIRRLLARKEFTRRRAWPIKLDIAGVLVRLVFQHTTSKALAYYLDNSKKLFTTARNFEQPAPEVSVARNHPDLLVYIGESSSTMNMGVYGYPRPTTPRLSERARMDSNLIVFDHVFATHARTSRSLLEALSLGLDDGERFLPIMQRKRLSIVDVLGKAGVASSLISNQGIGDSWDQAIGDVRQVARPLVLVYFSDHGDAVYLGMGHDSARFRHEMARVPFLIYFNDAARRENAGLYAKYRQLAQQKESATLALLAATLMDLMGVKLQGTAGNTAVVTPLIGEKTVLPPIMVRDTDDGTTFVNANDFPLQLPAAAGRKLIDKTDDDTKTYAAVRSGRMSLAQACQKVPVSFEEASRRIMVTGCPLVSFPGQGPEASREVVQALDPSARR